MSNPPNNEDDENERSNPLGFFKFAESYWEAAGALEELKLKKSHAHAPVYFLYYHAIELYLKSFLRLHHHSAQELRGRKFGHRICRLKEHTEELGLTFTNEDVGIFSLMATTDAIIGSRYIRTGFCRWPTIEGLDDICKRLRKSVGGAIKELGICVRL